MEPKIAHVDELDPLLRDLIIAFTTAQSLMRLDCPVFEDEDDFGMDDRKDVLCWRAIQLAVYAGGLLQMRDEEVEYDRVWASEVCKMAYVMFDEPIVDNFTIPTIDHDLAGSDTLTVVESRSLREWYELLGGKSQMARNLYLDGVLKALATVQPLSHSYVCPKQQPKLTMFQSFTYKKQSPASRTS